MHEKTLKLFLSFGVCQQTLFGSIYGEIIVPVIVSKLWLPWE